MIKRNSYISHGDALSSSSMSVAVVVLTCLLPKHGLIDLSVVPLAAFFLAKITWLSFRVDRRTLLVLMGFGLLVCVSIAAFVLYGEVSLAVLLKPIRNAILVFLFYDLAKQGRISLDDTISGTMIAGIINSVVVFIQLLSQSVFGVDGFMVVYPLANSFGAMRQQGLSSGFPSSALLSVLSFSIALIRYASTSKAAFLLYAILALPGVLFSARTGTLFGMMVFFLVFAYAVIMRRVRATFGMGATLLACVSLAAAAALIDARVAYLWRVMFEYVLTLINKQKVGVSSTDDLFSNHYFLPSGDWYVWLIGNGKGAWSEGGIPSDVWFTQVLVGSGVIGIVLYSVLFLSLVWTACAVAQGWRRVVVVAMALMVAVSSIKGDFIFSRFVCDPLTIAGGVALGLRRQQSRTWVLKRGAGSVTA